MIEHKNADQKIFHHLQAVFLIILSTCSNTLRNRNILLFYTLSGNRNTLNKYEEIVKFDLIISCVIEITQTIKETKTSQVILHM